MGAIADEAAILGAQGIIYINIPVDFLRPAASDYALFRAVLGAAAQRKILVHCQVNRRASAFLFLYGVLELGLDPDDALEQVHRNWAPDSRRTDFMNAELRARGLAYEVL